MSDNWGVDLASYVTDVELDKAFANANFGSISKREVIKQGLLKCAGRFYQGQTSKQILQELGLVGKGYTLTKKGARYLYFAYEGDNTI